MKGRKKLMDTFIEQTFALFYKLMRGNFEISKLSEEERIISECVKNECMSPSGNAYRFYKDIEKIKKTKNIEKILKLKECILQVMCEKMFFNALKLGFVLQKNPLLMENGEEVQT